MKIDKELLALHFDSLGRMSEWTIFWAIIFYAVKHGEYSLTKIICIIVVAFALSLVFRTMAWRARKQVQEENKAE